MHSEAAEAGFEHQRDLAPAIRRKSAEHKTHARLEFSFVHRASSGDKGEIERRNLAYLRRHGVLRDEASERRYFSYDAARCAMMLYPAAMDEGLEIAVDALAWCALWVDEYDRPHDHDPQAAASLIWELVGVTLHRAGIEPLKEVQPLTWAFIDLWRRETRTMSLLWQQRAAANWRRWLLSSAQQHIGKTDAFADTPLMMVYLLERERIGGGIFGDLIESSLGFEMPRGIHESAEIRELTELCFTSMRWANDLCDVQNERRDDVCNNVILSLKKEYGLGKDQAIEVLIRMHDRLMHRWNELGDHMNVLYATFRLNEDERVKVDRYVMALGNLVAGHYEWRVRNETQRKHMPRCGMEKLFGVNR